MADKKVKDFALQNSTDQKALAEELKKFIREQKLFQNIQGKEYVNVEGWQYAGSRLGLTSYATELIDISTDTEIKYRSKVVVIDVETQHQVGGGFAICSNKEQGKKFYQEYAIASMAQTRGVSKAYRLFLAQLLRMAGFEPTPAEEMDGGYDGNTEPVKKMPAKKEAKGTAEVATDEAQAPAPSGATDGQKKSIRKLLENSTITEAERTKMLPMVDNMLFDRAREAMAKLEKTIEEREAAVKS